MFVQRLVLMFELIFQNADHAVHFLAKGFELAVHSREPRLEAGIQAIEPRVDGLEPRVDGVEPRVNGLEPRVDRVEPRIDRVEPRVDRVEPFACTPLGATETGVDSFGKGFDSHPNAAQHSIVRSEIDAPKQKPEAPVSYAKTTLGMKSAFNDSNSIFSNHAAALAAL